MIDYEKFRLSLARLREQLHNYRHLDPSLSELTREGVAESVIHRFETCYDCMWKALKRYMKEELGLPNVPNSPKAIFRLASENHLLDSPVEHWLGYANHRVDTSHNYNQLKAEECLTATGDFIADATALYETMTGESWE